MGDEFGEERFLSVKNDVVDVDDGSCLESEDDVVWVDGCNAKSLKEHEEKVNRMSRSNSKRPCDNRNNDNSRDDKRVKHCGGKVNDVDGKVQDNVSEYEEGDDVNENDEEVSGDDISKVDGKSQEEGGKGEAQVTDGSRGDAECDGDECFDDECGDEKDKGVYVLENRERVTEGNGIEEEECFSGEKVVNQEEAFVDALIGGMDVPECASGKSVVDVEDGVNYVLDSDGASYVSVNGGCKSKKGMARHGFGVSSVVTGTVERRDVFVTGYESSRHTVATTPVVGNDVSTGVVDAGLSLGGRNVNAAGAAVGGGPAAVVPYVNNARERNNERYAVTAGVYARDGNDTTLIQFVSSVRSVGEDGFSSELVPWDNFGEETEVFEETRIVAAPVQASVDHASWGMNFGGISAPVFRKTLNEVMTTLFGSLLELLGMDCVTSLNQYLKGGTRPGSHAPSKSPNNIIFSAIPEKDHLPSVSTSRAGQPEFIEVNGRPVVNSRFWKSQMEHYSRGDLSVLKVMQLAAFLPSWTFHDSQFQDHEDACQWFASNNCGLGNDFILLTLFNQYASAFVKFMDSQLVRMGRKLGFRPLFLLRNCLLAPTKFGRRGYHFASVDRGAKSSLLLIGFWRMPDGDPNSLQVVSLQANGSYLQHYTS